MKQPAGHPVYLYTRMFSRSKYEQGKDPVEGSQHMFAATPTVNTKLQRGYTYHLNVNWVNPDASLWPDMSGSRYIILGQGKTGL
jgi:hypothetical protein